jgi:hypothetical protein
MEKNYTRIADATPIELSRLEHDEIDAGARALLLR